MSVERVELAPGFSISRIIKGGWQLADGHSGRSSSDPIEDMVAFADAGITTFDCADIYTGVEELIGRFLKLRKARQGSASYIQVLTKFVPDRDALQTISKTYVEKIIDRSLQRLGVERLDVVQFHWWSYDIPRYVETACWLKELQQAGKIHLISGTNFDTQRVRELVAAGVPLATMQVQYSLLDRRPEKSLVEFGAKNCIHLLCYGTVAGGFLSERWLGAAEPKPPFENRSLLKYKLIIDAFGGWDLFQELLHCLKTIADNKNATLTSVASRYALDRRQVAGIIVGARSAEHIPATLDAFRFSLDAADVRTIENILAQARPVEGDVFELERDGDGPHGAIMRYNLNKV
ncbi:MAG: aldo/keto reductase [Cytophagales bacterium]|nr:aldo/keto reductase [Cytophagales bacterium]